ncbi:alpha/beta fold hydrolase [Actinokineospora sp. NBRC 105648]|uniref:thioesterase II family protein n=1 Tax=Actinokineospora sp. NBRC 105648 TaxID=3032206 RepID=UPI0024A357F3|nr:alpha/beta fold hydrolase [Actinokineospora sp. NBRC 105648]GLZ41074.1 thioesterase [Actinokineospora sp. NBRC 105648]
MDDDPAITLVCLPFAGAGASFFRPWSDYTDLRVLPLQLPGRERRVDEEPHRDVHAAVDGLRADLVAALDPGTPVALFGHSLGAVLAYELAHRLVDGQAVEVVRLFASGSPEPRAPRRERATGLSDADFLNRVSEFAGYNHTALDDPEMREMFLPALRADVEMHENYRPSTDQPLAVPITALRGEDDELVGYRESASWSAVAAVDFEHVELPGGHMYLTEAAPALLRLISSTVR